VFSKKKKKIWSEYADKMKQVLEGYRDGAAYNIKMLDNGLIYAGEKGMALTWMDAVVAGKPVTPRMGMPVEINALWYNAVKFSIEVAGLAGDDEFVKEWSPIALLIEENFKEVFWSKERAYLADVVDGEFQDWSVRPNQIIAVSMPFSPLPLAVGKLVLDKVKDELLTPYGLRTLSPQDVNYKPVYMGSQAERDNAYHQGTVWPWLLGHFAEAYLKIHKHSGLSFVQSLVDNFEDQIMEHGIGSISEIYDGDPPHHPRGAISQAWSVAEVLRIIEMLKSYKE